MLDDATNEPSEFKRKIVKKMMSQEEHIMPVIKLNLKLQWEGQTYVIIAMHT